MRLARLILINAALRLVVTVQAADINVALAANLTAPTKEIASTIKRTAGHGAAMRSGANGQCYNHVTQGAQFQISADTRPTELVVDETVLPEGRFINTIGNFLLWKSANFVNGAEMSKRMAFAKLSICLAETPFKVAVIESVSSPSVHEAMQPKGIEGATVTRADQYEIGYDELAFVTRFQLIGDDASRWLMPQELHGPIEQGAASSKGSADREATLGFISERPEAHVIIERYG
ncbi:molybdate ABC transporter substrate-binding protein [Bradyrhizobium sp. CSA112]|uniref:molybdate ABC transporter substrate-binding protein n=1 Tax=Bradyrhizobium sp. CSA112 TaxID=2699170 RepID=UPI0023AFC7CC|nr:molybdate ABC transporter substrate-binding protein [Bradyrhizobium sp. CSA112]MDE5458949.1 molybdate ABC transporter substrate-binding protein [Bradyrhizobium sp. CSA112]